MGYTSNSFKYEADMLKEIFLSTTKYLPGEIILTDENFKIIFNNSKYVNGKSLKLIDFINDFLNIDIEKHLENFKKSEKKHLLIKLIYTQEEDFQKIPVNLHICKIPNKKNIIKSYLILIQDITQEVKNHIQKETFIDIISHDLKNPIRANIQILEQILKNKFGILETNLKVILDELLNSCRFMNYMTDNLLIKYKNELSLYELKKEKYSLIKLIKEKCSNLTEMLDRKHQTVELSVNSDVDNIDIDVNEMGKVINNLIINASEQSRENSIIKIKIEDNKNNIAVSFIDTGLQKIKPKSE